MILYVNGDSHTAGAEAVNPHAFAGDDGLLVWGDRSPHPDNLAVSWCNQLATALNVDFHCDAESASSNTRILRTTNEWLANNKDQDKLVIIQWSTWEREEWEYEGVHYQVNGSGIDMVPQALQEKYRNYIIGLNWEQKTNEAHEKIWDFHRELKAQHIPHIFFNGNNDFEMLTNRKDWGVSYINPYSPLTTYNSVIRSAGVNTVNPKSWHFGADGHKVWSDYLLSYITQNKFI